METIHMETIHMEIIHLDEIDQVEAGLNVAKPSEVQWQDTTKTEKLEMGNEDVLLQPPTVEVIPTSSWHTTERWNAIEQTHPISQ